MENITTVNATLNETAKNATGREAATTEGLVMAYSSLIIMAVLPIFFGSFRSVLHYRKQKENGEKPDSMTHKDAMMFPVVASGALLGLYIIFKLFNKDYLNLLLALYFFFLGVLALTHLLKPNVAPLLSSIVPNVPYHLTCTEGTGDKKTEIMDYEFDRIDLICVSVSTIFGIWYLVKKHWIANNVLGLAFAVNGVELLQLNSVITGCILLGGLFIYDIFWVFGTDVMVTVAKSFEAPIKLIFPMDILERGLAAKNFAMLGLGDIVIPGIFIALLLRFDRRNVGSDSKRPIYFYFTMVAYFLGLLLTVLVMHVFKAAQPALLYLVPACLGTPIILALLKGDIKSLFTYQDHTEEALNKKPDEASGENANKENASKEGENKENENKESAESDETKKSL
ncbi:minor histocompatibility antigen H13-like [Dendronephthya gigantea]|uniref:minor histocompatibility antigen H13-like n=1 Tax=Dendronephthya gigantea TaxID=151771 RepID=UPI00106CBF0E|nr:minor histocompatibility antigen H13-like [Dendronephthya gigantea]